MSHVLEGFAAHPDVQRGARALIGDDLVAAEAIAYAAAEGHPGAQEFVRSCKIALGEAAIRRARACRLQEGSISAATMGFQALASMGSDAATEEFGAADALEAKVCSAVRRAHGGDSFGYLTPEETRELRRKTYEASLTSEQREQVMDMLLAKLWQDESQSRGKIKRDPSEVFAAACVAFGGDVESVFGANALKKLSDTFRRNAEQLKAQIAKLTKLKDTAQEKLDSAESEGKMGMKVGVMRNRVKSLTRRIAKLKKRLDKLQVAKDEVDIADKDSQKLESAEASALETAEPKEESDGDEGADDVLGAVLLGAETAIVDEIEVFGLTKRRVKKARKALEHLKAQLATAEAAGHTKRAAHLEKRIARLEARMNKAEEAVEAQGRSVDEGESEDSGEEFGLDEDLFGEEEDDSAPQKSKKHVSLRQVTRLQDRLSVLRQKLEEAEDKGKTVRVRKLKQAIVVVRAQLQKLHDKGAKVSEDDLLRPDEDDSYVTKDPGTYKSSSEYVQSYFGFDAGADRGFASDAAPVVGFFAARATRHGVDSEGAFGAEGGIFQRIGHWLSSLFTGKKHRAEKRAGAYVVKTDPAGWLYQIRADGTMTTAKLLSNGSVEPIAKVFAANDPATLYVRKRGSWFANQISPEAARRAKLSLPGQSGAYLEPGKKDYAYFVAKDGKMVVYDLKQKDLVPSSKVFSAKDPATKKVLSQFVRIGPTVTPASIRSLFALRIFALKPGQKVA